MSYEDKLQEYRRLSDAYFQVDDYRAFCDEQLGHLDELVVDYVESPEFGSLLVETVVSTFPPHEHEQFIAHFRGLLSAWAADQHAAQAPAPSSRR
jgi:hypothetical protein